MMINLTALLSIAGGLIVVGGSIVGFFNMQVRQNMRIEMLEKEVCDMKTTLTNLTKSQTETEKNIVSINEKLDHILEAIAELKKKGIKG